MDGAPARDRRLAAGTGGRVTRPASAAALDPLELTVMANAVAMIAEEMGVVLVRGALSPNIRERRDASAALFDADGRMIAQAAHIPVHLGAMPESVRAVIERRPDAGDVFLLNAPHRGGARQPALTLAEAVDAASTGAGHAPLPGLHANPRVMGP